jgi:predicted nucleic acid-binding Zn ribbon protein
VDIEDQFSLEHLLFSERKCKSCGQIKDLITDYYVSRREKKYLPSSYSYECKDCTIKRIVSNRKITKVIEPLYPDW